MIRLVRQGRGIREVARKLRVSPGSVLFWVHRSKKVRLDRLDLQDRSHVRHRLRKVSMSTEKRVLELRRWLKEESALGEFGAVAIHRELVTAGAPMPPSVRSIGYILERHGALDYRRRLRRTPPPRGWYLPSVRDGNAELDSWDYIEDLALKGKGLFDVLNVVSLHGGLAGSWPQAEALAKGYVEASRTHWRTFGLPRYTQFDNDTRFIGVIGYKDVLSRVVRHCLNLGVIPVFTPPRETGFQAAVESYNARWQTYVWHRFQHENLNGVKKRSAMFVAAYQDRLATRIEAAPARRPFPPQVDDNIDLPPRGQLILLRRTSAKGTVNILGHTIQADRHWIHRLVRAEVNFDDHRIRIHALRRAVPEEQPLLQVVDYEWKSSKSRAR